MWKFTQEGLAENEIPMIQPWVFKNGFVYMMKTNRDSSECEVLRYKVEVK